ncbi:4-hydroxy-tetrahydrodipicolinate synthase [Pseudobythopirellula maris]|uniref:4-hydroxy-tetrahydrodipicolinate synthase n=1 Tax=Pseudobythopirellula maris TaxID=2527991 RepID=A0A5C5ZTK6_9BACT|nr:4-hydroxy-tetrahydrodipicolinate synthase [Pseudobythopirellula maris]TWT90171.1 4-hydroxy-tetrahydrodipicolinate synthase [Pseudobythopirellula maris]
MDRKGSEFAGVSVALTTPFVNGEVDYDRFAEQVEFQIAAGVDCLCPVGTTGESPTLSHDEHERVIAFVVEKTSGRTKVMPGTGSNSTAEAVRLTKFAERAGADAALQVAPYYNKPTQEGFYQHYKRLAEECGLPQCVYNIPGRTAKNIEPETIVRLAELENIAVVKEATGSLDQCSRILAETNLTVLSGDDSLTLPMMAVGASGSISVVANLVPGDVKAMVAAAAAGDFAAAREQHFKLFALCRDMLGLATNPIPVKAAMKLLGRDNGEMLLPMTPLEEPLVEKLRGSLTAYGLL